MAKKFDNSALHERVRELRAAVRPPIDKKSTAAVASLQELVEQGADVICVQPVKLSGVNYAIGDLVPADVLNSGKWTAKLLDGGYFVSRERWEASRKYSAKKKFVDNIINPAHTQLLMAETRKAKAQAKITAIRQLLSDAEAELRDAVAWEQQKAAELDEIINGREIE